MNQKEKLIESTILALQGKLEESRPQGSFWDNIALNNAKESKLIQFALDTIYKVKYYTVDENSFIHDSEVEIEVPSNVIKGDATDSKVEDYIKSQIPKGAEIEEVKYKYYEDEKAMQKRVRQFLGKSKKDQDREEKEAEEITYLQDKILDYERKGRGSKAQYEKDLARLHKLQGLD